MRYAAFTISIAVLCAAHAEAAVIIPAPVNPVAPMPVNPVNPASVNPVAQPPAAPAVQPTQKAVLRKKDDNDDRREHHGHHGGRHVNSYPVQTVIVDNSAASVLWYEADPRNNPRTDMVPTNVWSSNIYRVTAGYSPTNPLAGLIMLEDLRNGFNNPRIIYTPTATGPVRLISVNFNYGVPSTINVESQAGDYTFYDGFRTDAQTVTAPGQTRYMYDNDRQRFFISN